MGYYRWAAIFTAVALAMTAYGASAEGVGPHLLSTFVAHPDASGKVTWVNITAEDTYAFTPPSISVGTLSVIIIVHPGQSLDHTFTLSDQVNSTASSVSFFQSKYYVNKALNASGPAVGPFYVNFTTPGSYEFACIPHFALGMYGFFYVQMAAPQSAPSFQAFWYVVITVVTLATMAFVLGVVYGKRGSHAAGPTLPRNAHPITSRVEYYNDSRPDPLDAAEPSKGTEPPPGKAPP